ncbi:uncharacterized protein [Haliotis cracherodii]|uniref:uncharacterized protein n=1 Tax=Haliotis cracherodii TaxID=6455 RepID=UPI0039E84B0C
MEDMEVLTREAITTLTGTTKAYNEKLSDISESMTKLEEDKADKGEVDKHEKHTLDGTCRCRIFMDLIKEQDRQDKLDQLHIDILEANKDLMTSLSRDAEVYRKKYGELREERGKALQSEDATQRNVLRCPSIAFDRETGHKDVTFTEEGALHNQTTKDPINRHDRELSNVTGAVGNRCFFKTDIGYFGVKADVQIVRTAKIDKARLYDIFDVYIGEQDVIDKLRDPGVLYQQNMFGVNVWYSNMREEVIIDILSSSKHLDRYTLPKKVKHGGRFQIELGFLVDMQRATIHVLDGHTRKVIGSARKLNTTEPMWPAVQIHHCYYEPQYFDTNITFARVFDGVKSDNGWRKYLMSLVKEREHELIQIL